MGERFEIRGEVSRDEVTVLLRAFDRQMQREVVLKRLSPETSSSTDCRTRMIREARALAQVRSPYILSVYEVGEDEEGPYLSMEPARGESLRERVQRLGPLDVERVVQYGIELCQALSAVHRGRIIHGSLDASQVFLDDSGEVRLTGFAVARRNPDAPAPDTMIGQSTSLISVARQIQGPYAPEEVLGGHIDARSDLFALGVLLVECLTGSKPYPVDADGLSVNGELLRKLRPDVPSAIDQVIGKAIEASPDDRHACAADFGAALRATLEKSATAGSAATSASSPPWKAIGATLAAAVVLISGLWFTGVFSSDGGSDTILAGANQRGVSPGTRGGARPEDRFDQGYEGSHALVVGINRYVHEAWQDLEQAEADAEAMASFLIKEEDFPEENVHLLCGSDATRDAIRRVLLSVFANDEVVGRNDRILFFFAGHGQQQLAHARSNGMDRIGYLVPYDGTDETYSYIMHEVIKQATDLTPAKHFLMLLDCCYAGWAATRGPAGMAGFKSATTGFARQVLTAGKPGEPVGDTLPGTAAHSPFTHFLLEGLRGQAGQQGKDFITASELGLYVKSRVQAATDDMQNPVWSTFRGMGDFVFRPKALEAAASKD